MPSPFPGMDPYLEGSRWTSFHYSFSAEVARYLAQRVGSNYLVLAEERFVLDIPDDVAITTATMRPDVSVMQEPYAMTGVAVATLSPPLELYTAMPEQIPHITLEIRDVANRDLVTAIEFLSPTNKRGDGREEYLAKRGRILLSKAHLVEIDLIRQGQRVPMRQSLPAYPYFVFVGRAEKRPWTDVWPIAYDAPLPTIPVPLLSGDADIPLDLQAIFTTVYDTFRYHRILDYSKRPEVPLRGEVADWAEERLRAAGLRE